MNYSVPESIKRGGAAAIARYLYAGTPLGELLRTPTVSVILAQDMVLMEIEPYLRVLLPWENESVLIEKWLQERGHFAKALKRQAEDSLREFGPLESRAGQHRLMLRVAAMRRIDASFCGSAESYRRTPELGGDPHYSVRIPGMPEGHRLMQVGVVAGVHYKPGPRTNEDVSSLCASPSVVKAVEAAIAGVFPAQDTPDEWDIVLRRLDSVRGMREWERTQKVPVFLGEWWFDLKSLPQGISLRHGARVLLEQVGHEHPLMTLHHFGITPFVVAPVAEYLENRKDDVVAYASNFELGLDRLLKSAPVQRMAAEAQSPAAA